MVLTGQHFLVMMQELDLLTDGLDPAVVCNVFMSDNSKYREQDCADVRGELSFLEFVEYFVGCAAAQLVSQKSVEKDDAQSTVDLEPVSAKLDMTTDNDDDCHNGHNTVDEVKQPAEAGVNDPATGAP